MSAHNVARPRHLSSLVFRSVYEYNAQPSVPTVLAVHYYSSIILSTSNSVVTRLDYLIDISIAGYVWHI